MAVLKSSELKFSQPLKVAVGAYFLTATKVEIPATKEYEAGTVEISPERLGLVSVGGSTSSAYEGAVGEVATTTANPDLVWCSAVTEAKTTDEASKEVKEGYLASVSVVSGKVVLRVYSIATAGDGKPINEAKTATKVTFTAAQVLTIFALGK